MATKFYLYKSDGSENPDSLNSKYHIIPCDDAVMSLYPDLIKKFASGSVVAASAPTAYNDVAAALAAHPDALQSAITPRGLNINVSGFGSAFLPVLRNPGIVSTGIDGQDWACTLDHYGLDDATPFPVAGVSESHLTVQITGYRGESRSAN